MRIAASITLRPPPTSVIAPVDRLLVEEARRMKLLIAPKADDVGTIAHPQLTRLPFLHRLTVDGQQPVIPQWLFKLPHRHKFHYGWIKPNLEVKPTRSSTVQLAFGRMVVGPLFRVIRHAPARLTKSKFRKLGPPFRSRMPMPRGSLRRGEELLFRV